MRSAPAAEVQRVAPGCGMGPEQRVYRAGRLARVGDVLEAFAQLARAVAARVVAALQRHDRALQVGGQRVVGFVDDTHCATPQFAANLVLADPVQFRHK